MQSVLTSVRPLTCRLVPSWLSNVTWRHRTSLFIAGKACSQIIYFEVLLSYCLHQDRVRCSEMVHKDRDHRSTKRHIEIDDRPFGQQRRNKLLDWISIRRQDFSSLELTDGGLAVSRKIRDRSGWVLKRN